MPTVTGANREEFIRKEMDKKKGVNKKKQEEKHPSASLPGLEKAKILKKLREHEYRYANQASAEFAREIPKGYAEMPMKMYGEDMSESKDPRKWIHAVRTFEHETMPRQHIVTSQHKKGFDVHHYSHED
jgi:hypothetical protein